MELRGDNIKDEITGGTLGGKLADWRRMPSLIATLALIGIVLALFAGTMHLPFAALATIFVWGILAFAIVPPLRWLSMLKGARKLRPPRSKSSELSSLRCSATGLASAGSVASKSGSAVASCSWSWSIAA